MFRHPVLSFLAGLVISGAVIGLTCLAFFVFTFNLAGGETWQQVQQQRWLFIGLQGLLLVIAAVIALGRLKKKKRWSALGIILPCLIAAITVWLLYSRDSASAAPFESSTWQQTHPAPLNMAITLTTTPELTGFTKDRVLALLGPGVEAYRSLPGDNRALDYSVQGNWILTVFFEQGTVSRVSLRRPWLGV